MNQCWQSLLSTISVIEPADIASLPDLYLCPLTDNSLISLQGEQSHSYLQGQLTCDMDQLNSNHYLNAAHCNAKGKMWAILKAFTLNTSEGESFFLSAHQAEATASLEQLKKYGVFAKATITDASEQWLTFGLGGQAAEAWLQSHWSVTLTENHTAATINKSSNEGTDEAKVLKIADQRYLLIIHADNAQALLAAHQQHIYSKDLWSIADINAGVAHLDHGTIEQHVPQMLNLHCLNAISFTKGCYTGQEMVARMKYLGKNKRAAFILQGHAGALPKPADELQLAIGDNWRRSGSIINVAGNADKLHILAVLPNDVAADAQLRIKDDEHSTFVLSPLPYSLDTDNE